MTMSLTGSRTVYVNGAFVPEAEARVSIFDRGFLFADAVYEVTPVLRGRLVENEGHMRRLERSLAELKMAAPVPVAAIPALMEELVRLNGVEEGVVYLQVSRGAADRDFVPAPDLVPTLVMFTQSRPLIDTKSAREGLRVVTLPDLRWTRRDIKTVQLLGPSITKMAARAQGADDAWMVEDGFITEGTSNNAWIVTRDGTIVTRHLSHDILHGITRASVLALAQEAQMRVEERPFTVEEAREAAEAFITSASSFVTPVVSIDGAPVGEGVPGPLARRLREIYVAAVLPA
jgi:D-alanine transaminase